MRMVDLMDGYFKKQNLLTEAKVSTANLPVRTQKVNDWKIVASPQRFVKKFKLKNHDKFLNFVIAVLQYEDSSKHNAKITIGYPEVIIEVWTHKLDRITEMDKEYCREVDHIIKELE
jgi:pterin-4a-carbinolamine dehydratase